MKILGEYKKVCDILIERNIFNDPYDKCLSCIYRNYLVIPGFEGSICNFDFRGIELSTKRIHEGCDNHSSLPSKYCFLYYNLNVNLILNIGILI